YRYESVGGTEFVTDLLIGSRDPDKPLTTLPGDSGTLWVWDPPPEGPSAAEGDLHPAQATEAATPRADGAGDGAAGPGGQPAAWHTVAMQWGGHRLVTGRGGAELPFALATSLSTVCRQLNVRIVRDWNVGHRETWGKVAHYKIGAKACDLVADA